MHRPVCRVSSPGGAFPSILDHCFTNTGGMLKGLCCSSKCIVLSAGLARLVGQAFLPGTTHENIRKAAEEDPEHFRLAKRTGVLGTAEVLDMVRDHIGTFVLG